MPAVMTPAGEKREAKSDGAEEVSEAVAVDGLRAEGGGEGSGEVNSSLQNGASESVNVWNDEAAESAFRAEARERGESVSAPARSREDSGEGDDTKNLPPLDDLVQRIPSEVRETLDDLFRVKFTTVRRVPKNALKS
jgi:hypothetical protein